MERGRKGGWEGKQDKYHTLIYLKEENRTDHGAGSGQHKPIARCLCQQRQAGVGSATFQLFSIQP